ncbi:MAG: type II CRISPR-associated endonuclease Cas1 [Alphaproteobacteria bacterium]|nr:type II CRISPR-associated endonuclease Cas1 [Alphaproteobacteria bacterium]
MIGRIIEIAQDNRHLAAFRGFMTVSEGKEELGRVPLADIGVVVVNAHGVSYSNNLLVALAEQGAILILCGPNHAPVAWVWPMVGHHAQAARMLAQLEATKPLGKRLWQILIRAKIEQQGAVLNALGKSGNGFRLLARQVASGDPTNLEAQAARRYWPLLFGEDFRRDRSAPGLNGLLNYGYTVLRSATARAVVAAGLHPSLGIHHRHRANDMCLVDDLMEPFRPLVDLLVVRLVASGIEEVNREAKETLAGLTIADMHTAKGMTPLGTCLERLAASLGQAFESGETSLDLPLSPLPLDLAADS